MLPMQGAGSVFGWGTKILHAMQHGQKIFFKERCRLWNETSCVILGKLLNLSGPQFLFLQNGITVSAWESPWKDEIS